MKFSENMKDLGSFFFQLNRGTGWHQYAVFAFGYFKMDENDV